MVAAQHNPPDTPRPTRVRPPTEAPPLLCTLVLAALVAAPDGPTLKDGDRVVLVGGTMIEREQAYGYLEATIAANLPDTNITYRNLGWSGDTVRGEAQAGFGSAADGFKHLKEHVATLKPTVILVGVGANESFAGAAGLADFERDLKVYLDMLAATGARLALLGPTRMEDMGRPLPDPVAHNRDLRLYSDAIAKVAASRGDRFIELYQDVLAKPGRHLTENGIHLNAEGYRRLAEVVARGLGVDPSPATIAPGTASAAIGPRCVRADKLPAGVYRLSVGGEMIALADADGWALGVETTRGVALRNLIVAKDRLYFHRWRPENETYLFGFRKHEQGNNAREIPEFDPLVAKLETEIAALRAPTTQSYTLKKLEVPR